MRALYFFVLILLTGCNSSRYLVSNTGFPKAPDYKYMKNWAASPKKEIALPSNYIDSLKSYKEQVDVFYVYPTVYYSGYDGNFWNSNPEDPDHINRVNSLTLNNQASVFSGITNVYAPFYRQLFYDGIYYHISNEILTKIALDNNLKKDFKYYRDEIFSSKSLDLFTYENNKLRSYAKESYDLAYNDVKRAFLKYLETENKEKKIIIVGHSQGTLNAERLIKEVILPSKKLKEKLLLAYLVGMPISDNLKDFKPCKNSDEINCFMSWNTYGENFNPLDNELYNNIVATNPITFKDDLKSSNLLSHKGTLMPNFFQMFKYKVLNLPIGKVKLKKENKIRVQSNKGALQVKEIKIPLIKILEKEDFHAVDYNLFWLNIRENLYLRLSTYFDE